LGESSEKNKEEEDLLCWDISRKRSNNYQINFYFIFIRVMMVGHFCGLDVGN
jgi:hypothetical protein